MTGEPLVSVVLPTRDRARWVERAVESVLAQTYARLELIVVDDGSRDDTLQVLERFGSDIAVLPQARAGAYVARNLALRHASGELVAFIDSDDAWHPHRLAAQLPLMQRPAVGLVFGDAVHVSPRRNVLPRTCFEVTPPRRGRVADDLAWGNFVPTSTVLVRRSCLDEVGGFPTSHAVSADYVTWFRIALRHELDYVDGPVADYTLNDTGISHDLGRSLLARIELFSTELQRTADPAVRTMLARLIFNLGLHLGLAAVRGRARRVPGAWRVVGRTIAVAAPRHLASWAGAFALHQTRVRTARRLRDARARARAAA